MKRTEKALFSRGFDSSSAKKLSDAGHTISSLKKSTDDELRKIGLKKMQILLIRAGGRPPIPPETVNDLLFKNRHVCCVCRDPSRSIIIHHIEPWEKSFSHDPSNLVVLCVLHHDEAHTKRELSRNLDKKALLSAKIKWENEANIRKPFSSDVYESVQIDWLSKPEIKKYKAKDEIILSYKDLNDLISFYLNVFNELQKRLVDIAKNHGFKVRPFEKYGIVFGGLHLISSDEK